MHVNTYIQGLKGIAILLCIMIIFLCLKSGQPYRKKIVIGAYLRRRVPRCPAPVCLFAPGQLAIEYITFASPWTRPWFLRCNQYLSHVAFISSFFLNSRHILPNSPWLSFSIAAGRGNLLISSGQPRSYY